MYQWEGPVSVASDRLTLCDGGRQWLTQEQLVAVAGVVEAFNYGNPLSQQQLLQKSAPHSSHLASLLCNRPREYTIRLPFCFREWKHRLEAVAL